MRLHHHALLLVPLVVWLLMFQFAGLIPNESRPHIDVTTLPTLERILFGDALLYRLFPGNVFFALLAGIPYLAHFSLPFVLSIYLWKIDKRPTLFLWYFGLMNATAVATQLMFPTAPPWYNARYGFDPANYELPGDPGRLKIVDDLLGVEIFQGIYGTSPLVFGSWPSLHAAWPFMISLYTSMFPVPSPVRNSKQQQLPITCCKCKHQAFIKSVTPNSAKSTFDLLSLITQETSGREETLRVLIKIV